MLIAIEGIDGAGKRTQANLLCENLKSRGFKAIRMSFPRYKETEFSKAISDYLNGHFGDTLTVSPYLSAPLFAGDRFESRELIFELAKKYDVVVLDRYISSNLAYQAAKLNLEERKSFIFWLSEIEYNIYNLPPVDLTVFLDIPIELVKDLINNRELRNYTDYRADIHERNPSYLSQCVEVYHMLYEMSHSSRWVTIKCTVGEDMRSIDDISTQIWGFVEPLLR